MITAQNLVFSKAAAERILNAVLKGIVKAVELIRRLANGAYQITYRTMFGRCSIFISRELFKKHFVERRKEEAKHLYASRVENNWYRVVNPKKGTSYNCYAYKDSIDCTCEDFFNQVNFLRKGCCKHGYALLKHLGFDYLSDYIEHHRWANNDHEPHPDPDDW